MLLVKVQEPKDENVIEAVLFQDPLEDPKRNKFLICL